MTDNSTDNSSSDDVERKPWDDPAGLIEILKTLGFTSADLWFRLEGDLRYKGFSLWALIRMTNNDHGIGSIDLSGYGMLDSDVDALFQHLSRNDYVREVILAYNPIDDNGARMIANFLPINRTIHSLDLSTNMIGTSGAIAIATALNSTTVLRHLVLDNNIIGNEAAKALACALVTQDVLQLLSLTNCNIGDEGVKALMTALLINKSLTALKLGWNRSISDASVNPIMKVLKFNSTLSYLEIPSTSMSAAGRHRFIAEYGFIYIQRTPEELDQAAKNNGNPWKEIKHHRMDKEFKTSVFNALLTYEISGLAEGTGDTGFLPWDDFRRILQAWGALRKESGE